VTEVFRSGEVKPAPVVREGADVRALEGVTSHDGDMVFVLDVTRLAELIDPNLVAQLEEAAAEPRRLA
jgi:chemotaxis signal transduction protein